MTKPKTKKPRSRNTVFWDSKPYLFAHRGGARGLWEENTLQSFEYAISVGCKYLETDVICSADGKVVAYHGAQNAYMQYKTGLLRRKNLQKLTYDQINDRVHAGKNSVPLISELLQAFPEACFSIDAKTWEAVAPLAALIEKHKAQNRVSLTSFRLKRTKKLTQLLGKDSGIHSSLCLYKLAAYPLMIYSAPIFAYLNRSGIQQLHVPYKCINKRLLDSAHKNYLEVLAWSVNDSKEFNRLTEIGVDGIISDDIAKLLHESGV